MSIALITEANPRAMRESHPSFLSIGRWRVTAPGVTTILSVRRLSLDHKVESIYQINDEFDGPCMVTVKIIEAKIEDSRISAYAERVNVRSTGNA